MDELTIKQKAEAYDKAIEKLRDFYRDYDIVSGLIDVKEELANMFPEIKESENERIKTFIRGLLLPHIADVHLEGDKVVHNKDIDNYRKALTWLDKQRGEKKPNPYSGTSFEYNGHTWGMCARDNGVDILYDKHIIGHFENQGATKLLDYDDFTFKPAMEAIKEEKVDNANKVKPKFKVGDTIINIYHKRYGNSRIKKITDDKYILDDVTYIFIKEQDNWKLVEQKPADKIEPKFHEGEWVVCEVTGLVDQIKNCIENLSNHKYGYELTNGGYIGSDEVNNYHLWTIADARYGNVLTLSYASKNYILIYKRLYEKGINIIMSVCCFYCVEENEYYDETDNFHVMNSGEIITPATYEQLDLLFAKMKEAGYEWDTKRKELKKIDSKPIFDAEIPFGAKDSELEEVFYNIPNGFHAEIEDDKIVIKKGEQKHWSKEDEKTIDTVISFLEEFSSKDYIVRKHCINWLKSLKDGVGYEVNCTTTRKSSDKHYELEEFAKIIRCNLTGISKAVQKLFEAKYLQLTGNKMYGGLKD